MNAPIKVTPKLAALAPKRRSAFTELGYRASLQSRIEEVQALYACDNVPWILGYSGGKDSTATLQLIWKALSALPAEARTKPIHVISTDTLVENPIVSAWVRTSLKNMAAAAQAQGIPANPRLLHPRLEDSFWVNLIGRGYPAPRPKFRWCTERLKIRPSNSFISEVVTANGEAILCLGVRREESTARAHVISEHARYRVRDRLSPSSTLPGCQIYSPIEDWTTEDVWFFLNNEKNPWGASNKDLMGMYAGATADGECPLVVDTSTPSCGDSRFGCWVCTLVEKDKSMSAMIQNDAEKEWMMPLLELRNALDFRNNGSKDGGGNDHHLRDFRRMGGHIQLMADGNPVPGPYTQASREAWLKRLLEAQAHIRKAGPPDVAEIELVTLDELQEIRRIWVADKHELEDSLPRLYQEATGQPYPGRPLDDNMVVGVEAIELLGDLCGDDRLHFELTRELISLTRKQRFSGRRAGLFDDLEKAFRRHFFDDRADALERTRRIAKGRGSQSEGDAIAEVQEIAGVDSAEPLA